MSIPIISNEIIDQMELVLLYGWVSAQIGAIIYFRILYSVEKERNNQDQKYSLSKHNLNEKKLAFFSSLTAFTFCLIVGEYKYFILHAKDAFTPSIIYLILVLVDHLFYRFTKIKYDSNTSA